MDENSESRRSPARTFMDLIVWQKAHALVLEIYRATATFPKSEETDLVSQMRRAAKSVPSNIVEGFKRRTKPDKVRMLNIAQGSLEELRNHLLTSRALSYLADGSLIERLEEVSKMLHAYVSAIRSARKPPGSAF